MERIFAEKFVKCIRETWSEMTSQVSKLPWLGRTHEPTSWIGGG